MSRTRARLERLEAATAPQSRVVVVDGYTAAEHEAKIAALKASGAAREGDLFVCIRRFFSPDEEGTSHEAV